MYVRKCKTRLQESIGINFADMAVTVTDMIISLRFFEFLAEPRKAVSRVFGLSVSGDFVIIACVVLTPCQRVTDEQTIAI